LRGWQQLKAPYETATVRLRLADCYRQHGNMAGAVRELEAARTTFERLGAVFDARDSQSRLDRLNRPGDVIEPAVCCFMFTDIVSSTQLVEAIGDDAWTQVISWHDRSLRACFARFGGEELDHTGDGFFVSFTESQSAADCAICIQRTLRDHRHEHGFAPRVRIGIHGAGAKRMDNSFRGRGVHEAARIASLAEGDEILASVATVPAETPTSNPRVVQLKGISAPVDVVTVEWQEP
jgi:class 3 adenylate cyclase